MYFSKFPVVFYSFNIGGKEVLKPVKDITNNVRLRTAILENITLFDEYDIKDGETPEIVAAKIYDNSQYHWVIMLCNQRYDYVNDFPRSTRSLEEYVNEKYEEPYGTHHWVNEQGFIVQEGVPGAVPVSNYQYEDDLNESKRRIKLISPRALIQILNQFKFII
jgi:hypothetical protein